MTFDIQHNESESRFETTIDGEVAFAEYETESDSIVLTHTIVPRKIEKRGVGSAIIRHALDYARRENLKVVPQCGFAAAFVERHPEYQDLVAVRTA